MDIRVLETISEIGFGVSGVMSAVTLALLWKLRIPAVWEELTGQRERREIQRLKEKPMAYGKKFTFPIEDMQAQNPTEQLDRTERLVDAQIQDETKLLEEFSYIPVKQRKVSFQLIKDEISVYEEENVTALLNTQEERG